MELFGIDPDETTAVELARFSLESTVRAAKDAVTKAKDEEEKAKAEAVVAVAGKALAEHKGGGPVFTVGHIEEAKWIELDAMLGEYNKTRGDPGAAALGSKWEREVVRWGLRGHQGFGTRGGKEIPFSFESVTFLGQPRQVVSDKTLEAYFRSHIMGGLAGLVFRYVGLGEDLKNG